MCISLQLEIKTNLDHLSLLEIGLAFGKYSNMWSGCKKRIRKSNRKEHITLLKEIEETKKQIEFLKNKQDKKTMSDIKAAITVQDFADLLIYVDQREKDTGVNQLLIKTLILDHAVQRGHKL